MSASALPGSNRLRAWSAKRDEIEAKIILSLVRPGTACRDIALAERLRPQFTCP